MINIKQERIPDNFLRILSDAKCDIEKFGCKATNLILPMKWFNDFREELKEEGRLSTLVDIDINFLMLFGCLISFGFIDTPIFSSDLKTFNVDVIKGYDLTSH